MESYCSEQNSFDIEIENGYISVHVEYKCDEDILTPTGRYFIYMLHPKRGSCTFYLEMDDNGKWIREHKPPFVAEELIARIIEAIESYNG